MIRKNRHTHISQGFYVSMLGFICSNALQSPRAQQRVASQPCLFFASPVIIDNSEFLQKEAIVLGNKNCPTTAAVATVALLRRRRWSALFLKNWTGRIKPRSQVVQKQVISQLHYKHPHHFSPTSHFSTQINVYLHARQVGICSMLVLLKVKLGRPCFFVPSTLCICKEVRTTEQLLVYGTIFFLCCVETITIYVIKVPNTYIQACRQ